jgi:UDP-N-acetylmuramate--alanine ligase
MNIASIHNVYFLGIGGIGMSALARYFHSYKKNVAGYDLTPSPITYELEKLGIAIHYKEDISSIPKEFVSKENTMIVRTPAVPSDHLEWQYFQNNGFTILKRAEVLGLLFNEKSGIAIAGTHGKTSVSCMTAFILQQSSLQCNAFLGGILKNINSNLIINESSDWVVAEADEFDRSFLHLKPEIALITWVDADHLDIYSTAKDIEETFEKFIGNIKEGGSVIVKKGIDLNIESKDIEKFTYALKSDNADFFAEDIRTEGNRYVFDIHTPGGIVKDVSLASPGMTNIENAVAAASVSFIAGVTISEIGRALLAFKGVQRRFDIQYENGRRIYIDDYAHHPRELDAVIGSIRKLYPGKKITGVFQPHLYSRTRDFANDFAASLSALDELILMDIYPAREKPIEGVNSEIIFKNVTSPIKTLCTKDNLLHVLSEKEFEILLTMGAGDIDRFVEPVRKMLEEK